MLTRVTARGGGDGEGWVGGSRLWCRPATAGWGRGAGGGLTCGAQLSGRGRVVASGPGRSLACANGRMRALLCPAAPARIHTHAPARQLGDPSPNRLTALPTAPPTWPLLPRASPGAPWRGLPWRGVSWRGVVCPPPPGEVLPLEEAVKGLQLQVSLPPPVPPSLPPWTPLHYLLHGARSGLYKRQCRGGHAFLWCHAGAHRIVVTVMGRRGTATCRAVQV